MRPAFKRGATASYHRLIFQGSTPLALPPFRIHLSLRFHPLFHPINLYRDCFRDLSRWKLSVWNTGAENKNTIHFMSQGTKLLKTKNMFNKKCIPRISKVQCPQLHQHFHQQSPSNGRKSLPPCKWLMVTVAQIKLAVFDASLSLSLEIMHRKHEYTMSFHGRSSGLAASMKNSWIEHSKDWKRTKKCKNLRKKPTEPKTNKH